jgi:competence protein ComEC
VTGALSFLTGALLGLLSADIPGVCWQAAAAVLASFCMLSPLRHRRGVRACALLMAGQLLALAQAQHWLVRAMPIAGADTRVLVEGRIDSVPMREGETLRFDLIADSVTGAHATHPLRLRVQWRDPHARCRVGERWRLLLRLLPAEETRNFAGPDPARASFREGVHGAGRVLPATLNELLALAPASLDTVRARIAARIRDAIADPDAAALVTALAVGLTADMSRDQWRVFNATGTTHLVAISGLHVTLFAWLAFRLARLGWRRVPMAMTFDREPFALSIGLAAAGGYALLAGFSVPTQRTWLMLALYVLARLAGRRVAARQLWAVALVLVLLLDVRAPLAAGFWLSFIAVGVLLAFATQAGAGVSGAVRVQLTVMLALMPASIATFGGVSLTGLAVNLLAIPLISFVFVPLVLLGALAAWLVPALATPCFEWAASLYEWLWPGLVWCADIPAWKVAPPGGWYLLSLPAALAWLCRWPWSLRITAGSLLLSLMFTRPPAIAPERARISVFDAGRGAAVLVRTAGHVLLFDTGDSWNTRGARLAQVVLPALDAAGIRRVDRLYLPQLDDDRARAAALLALERQLPGLWLAADWPGSGLPVHRCRDEQWTWDGVRFATHAVKSYCVLRVSAAGQSLMLGGSLDAAAEQALLARVPAAALGSDLLVIGRQASELASSPRWIETTAPGLAIATGGIEGASSRARVLERWRSRGARLLDTREVGAIELVLGEWGEDPLVVAHARFPFHWRRPV